MPEPSSAIPLGFPGMLRFDVFGKQIGAELEAGEWKLYFLDSPAGRRAAENLVVPRGLDEAGLATFLADLFHESARPDRPTIKRL